MREPRWVIHTAVDDLGSGMIDFIPMWSKSWRAFYGAETSLCIVGDRDQTDYVSKYGEWIDHLSVVKPLVGYSKPAISKLARMWSACMCPSNLPAMVDDMDWVPLEGSWMEVKFGHWKPGRIMLVGKNVYRGTEDDGKAPMGTATAFSSTWSEIVLPVAMMDFERYCAFESAQDSIDFDKRDNPHHPSNFSDESMLRRSLVRWNCPDRIIDIDRDYDPIKDALDRAHWYEFNIDKLTTGGYIGAHLPRPYNSYRRVIEPIETYIDNVYREAKK